MIAKRTQYTGDWNREPASKITEISQVKNLLEYFINEKHPNHVGVEIDPVQYHNGSQFDFIQEVVGRADDFKKRPKTRGKPWAGEIAEHLIFAPVANADLTFEERKKITKAIIDRVAKGCPAISAWHTNADGRQELHVCVSNIIKGRPPIYRITEIRREGFSDYLLALSSAAVESIEIVNRDRAPERRIPTLQEAIQDKHASILAAAAKLTSYNDDPEDVVALLNARGWKVRLTKKNISLRRPDDTRQTRFPTNEFFPDLREVQKKKLSRPEKVPEKSPQKHLPGLS